ESVLNDGDDLLSAAACFHVVGHHRSDHRVERGFTDFRQAFCRSITRPVIGTAELLDEARDLLVVGIVGDGRHKRQNQQETGETAPCEKRSARSRKRRRSTSVPCPSPRPTICHQQYLYADSTFTAPTLARSSPHHPGSSLRWFSL